MYFQDGFALTNLINLFHLLRENYPDLFVAVGNRIFISGEIFPK